MLMHPDVLFGDLRFNGSMRLPGAYRSLARPSSAPEPSHPLTGVKATSYVVSSNPCNVQKRLVYLSASPLHSVSLPRFDGVSSPSPVLLPDRVHLKFYYTSGPVGI